MKIVIDYSDGAYSWRLAESEDGYAVVDVPRWRVLWLRVASWVSRRVQRYLCRLDNKWHEEHE